MADNIGYTPGTGATVAADDIGGVLFQRVKVTAGTDGTATDMPGDATNGLDVDVTRMPDATTASGTLGALNATVSVALRGQAGAGVTLTTAAAAMSIKAEYSLDGGTTWGYSHFLDYAGTSFGALNTLGGTGGTEWYGIALQPGATHARVRVSAYTSGSRAVTLTASSVGQTNLPFVELDGNTHATGMGAVAAGADASSGVHLLQMRSAPPAAADYGLIVRPLAPTDGTNTQSIKAASTAAVAADKAAVVALHPTSPLPASAQLPASLVSGRLDVNVGAALPAGTNNIGDVDVLTLPSLPAGSNTIGSVTQTLGASLVSATNPLPVYESSPPGITYKGRVSTFRTPGRAGTAGQKIFALHNATGSTKVVTLKLLAVDITCTVVKAVTVLPPMIRCCRFTAVPTNGTTLTKVARDSALSSNASVTVWGDASADGTLSGTALTIASVAVNTSTSVALTQEFAPRLITGAGYEMFDRTEFFDDSPVTLRALEGVVVFLDYVLATQNPATDMWSVTCEWDET